MDSQNRFTTQALKLFQSVQQYSQPNNGNTTVQNTVSQETPTEKLIYQSSQIKEPSNPDQVFQKNNQTNYSPANPTVTNPQSEQDYDRSNVLNNSNYSQVPNSSNPDQVFQANNQADYSSPNQANPTQQPGQNNEFDNQNKQKYQTNQNFDNQNPAGQADGQFSPEEIEYLRSKGMLPEGVSPATPLQESALLPGMYKPLPEEILIEWIAPTRPFKKPNRSFFTNITMIGGLIALILFFANQVVFMAVVFAVVFMVYVLYSVPPGNVRHSLTTYGVRTENSLYYWEELGRFWITKSKGAHILNIEVARFPNRISLLLGDISPEDMTLVLSEVLLNEVPKPTTVEKMADWLKKKVPLDFEG